MKSLVDFQFNLNTTRMFLILSIQIKDYFETQNKAATYSGIISKAYEKKEAISYEKWTECYKYYSITENLDVSIQ